MNPSELERQSDEHGHIKSGVVFERIDRRTGKPVEQSVGESLAAVAAMTEAGLRAQVAALTSELATKAACIAAAEQALRVKDELLETLRAELATTTKKAVDTLAANRRLVDCWMTDMERVECELAAKDRFVSSMCERLKAAHDVIARNAERERECDPWPMDELEQYAGEPV